MTGKKVLLVLAVVHAVGSGSALIGRGNLLVNGDFAGGTGGTLLPGSVTGGTITVPTGWEGFSTGSTALQVVSQLTKFSAGNQPIGSYIQQQVTVTPGTWYVLDWTQTGNVAAKTSVTTGWWDGTDTSGPADYSHQFHWTGARQTLFETTGNQLTLRMSDEGGDTISSDTNIDNLNLIAADGLLNIAPYMGTPDASSQYTAGTWGNLNNAIDGGVASDQTTTFHGNVSTGGDWYRLQFGSPFILERIEIEARPGFNTRMGNTFEFLDAGGGTMFTEIINDSAASFGLDGYWPGVYGVRITDTDNHLNLAEVRTFARFSNGQLVVPEPSSFALLISGLLFVYRCRRTG